MRLKRTWSTNEINVQFRECGEKMQNLFPTQSHFSHLPPKYIFKLHLGVICLFYIPTEWTFGRSKMSKFFSVRWVVSPTVTSNWLHLLHNYYYPAYNMIAIQIYSCCELSTLASLTQRYCTKTGNVQSRWGLYTVGMDRTRWHNQQKGRMLSRGNCGRESGLSSNQRFVGSNPAPS